MLTEAQFEAWASRLQLAPSAIATLSRIRSSAPERRVSNAASNMCGSFASEKMGQTIQWESITGERSLVLLWEHDPSCLEMWDQPYSLKINYTLPTGKPSGCRTTVDFVTLMKDWTGGIDYKTSAELSKLALDQPYRWAKTGPVTWDQPPAREAFGKLGLGYRVLTEHDVPHVLVRNVEFLRPRLLRSLAIPTDTVRDMQDVLADEARIPLTQAIAIAGDANCVYEGHFSRHWYLELRQEALALPDCAWVYKDLASAHMFGAAERTKGPRLLSPVDPDEIPLRSLVSWGGVPYELVNQTAARVFLRADGQPIVELQRPDFRRLVRSGEIIGGVKPSPATAAGMDVMRLASKRSIDEALEKLKVIEAVRTGTTISQTGVPRRTYYDWKARFDDGEREFNNGFVGLISRHDLKGNRNPKTEEKERELLCKAFAWLREPVPREVKAGYAYYVALCANDSVEPRSFNSFNDKWNAEDTFAKTGDRQGARAAYPVKPPRVTGGRHVAQGPPEGDTPFGRVHIDHMISDTFCRRLNSTQLLGKPWLTIAIDATLRWVLGLWVSILAPSHVSVLMVLRDIVRRHGRLPMTVITDGGRDFHCKRVAKLLARYGSEHALRPKSEPRYGNPVERLNLDINHHLTKVWPGSNEVLKTPRMSSPSHDPRELSYLTVPSLATRVEQLLFTEYPRKYHAGLQCTVNEAIQSASMLQGTSWGRPVAFDEEFRFWTLAQPHRHGGLIRLRDGIRLNSYNYYDDALTGLDQKKLDEVPLYDAEDPTYIQARLGGQWSRCGLIDSQLRRLPPPEHRRFQLAEHIYLARPSTSKDKDLAFLAARGNMYLDMDAERARLLAAEGEVPRELESDSQRPSSADEEPVSQSSRPLMDLVPAPISHRERK